MEDAEEEVTMTLEEAIEAQEELENESVAVLGASDPHNCSYSKGYMKRQALYACLTCNPKGAPHFQSGGVCLACSYKCHEGHEMVELFTKRHFRCDCGTQKFPDNTCRLQPEKDGVNSENTYNQNFTGLYCSCHRPYPETDPEIETADDPMIQCVICEDWYHFQHSLSYLDKCDLKEDADYDLICGPCMGRLDFLGYYSEFALKPKPNVPIDVEGEDAKSEKSSAPASSASPEIPETKLEEQGENKSTQESSVQSSSSQTSTVSCDQSQTCPLDGSKQILSFSDTDGILWLGKLRSSLCRCPNCLAMYKDLKIEYLLDEEDTIEHYEAIGKRNVEAAALSAEADLNTQINNLGRVGQLEFIHGVNEFKEHLVDFLKEHNGSVITKEDVTNFFGELRAKRRRLN